MWSATSSHVGSTAARKLGFTAFWRTWWSRARLRDRRALRKRVDAALLLLCALTLVGSSGHAFMRDRASADLLRDAQWTTSSTYPLFLAPLMFFHTEDEPSPSITYALPRPTTLSWLEVQNSTWFPERAAPLAVEVSEDGATFVEVARIDRQFTTWKPHFPTKTVRYLRLRALKRTWLHLKRVEAHA